MSEQIKLHHFATGALRPSAYVTHSDHLAALEAARAADKSEIERLRGIVDALPADWRTDSSLETWFPYTAEAFQLWRARAEKAEARIVELEARQKPSIAVVGAGIEAKGEQMVTCRGTTKEGHDVFCVHSAQDICNMSHDAMVRSCQNSLSGAPGVDAVLMGWHAALRRDAERLRQFERWANDGLCPHLVFNDNGWWAVSFDGSGSVSLDEPPPAGSFTASVEADMWRKSPGEAIDATIAAVEEAK